MMIEEQIFNILSKLSFIFLFFSYLSQNSYQPKYLDKIDYYLKLYICLSLIWRFNYFRKASFNNLDRKIAFNAGLLLLSSTFLNAYKLQMIEFVKHIEILS